MGFPDMLVDDTTPSFPFVPRAYVPCVLSPTTLQCSVEHPRPSRELAMRRKARQLLRA